MDVRLLGPIATSCGICVSITLWILNRRKKDLSYRVLWQHPLLNLRGPIRTKLDVQLEGKNVSEAKLVVLEIFNSGHVPIEQKDFITEGLEIVFNPGAEILVANVIETQPVDLSARCKSGCPGGPLIKSIVDDKVVLCPVILNEKDSVTVQVLVKNASGPVTVKGHVKGIYRIKAWRPVQTVPKLLTHVGALTMAAAMLGMRPDDLMNFGIGQILPWLLLFLTGYVVLTAGMWWPRQSNPEFASN